jgi:hypothetical protein
MPWALTVAGVMLIGIAGIIMYGRMSPRPVAARPDPAVLVAAALTALGRSDTYRLTDEQRDAVLPLLRVLRDTDAADVEPSGALAQEIMNVLSPEQRAEVERMREEARRRQAERRAAQGAPGGPQGDRPGPGGSGATPGGPGAGVNTRARAQIRQRLLGRLIERLELRE